MPQDDLLPLPKKIMNDKNTSFFKRADDALDNEERTTRRPLERKPYERRPMGTYDDNRHTNKQYGFGRPPRQYDKDDRPRFDNNRSDRPYGDRDNEGQRYNDREDRPYGENRSGGDRENRYGDRDKPYGERRYADRDNDRSYGEKRYTDRGQGERRYGDRDSGRSFGGNRYGDRDKSYGDRKFGDKHHGKPYGDKRHGDRRFGDRDEERPAPENVIFGIHPVREALEAGKGIEKLYIRRREGGPADERYDLSALDALRHDAEEAGLFIQEVPYEKLEKLTHRGNHQGVVAVVPMIEYKELNELVDELRTAIEQGAAPLVVVADSVTDVRNFGAIARSAECAGAAAIIMPAKNSAPVNAEAIRSSAGALNLIPVCRAGSLKVALRLLKEAGLRVVAATEKADRSLYEADLRPATVIVMGAEDKGVSEDILELCDEAVGIPLAGRIESLNVSAAAAVILFEALRQRGTK